MKIRQGFVSNSSSSSFVIEKKYVSDYQFEKLKNHIEECKTFSDEMDNYHNDKYDRWSIYLDNDEIKGSTNMDNFDMEKFMELIGIPMDKVDWDHQVT